MKIYKYNIEKFAFAKAIKKLLETDSLENLEAAAIHPEEGDSLYKNIQKATAYQTLYQNLEDSAGREFYALYDRFIAEVMAALVSAPFYYQARPSHRILFYNVGGVARYHRDKDYGHDERELNFILPQTRCFATNSIWVESPKDGKLAPMKLSYGEFVQFDGANLLHGAKNNTTGQTRVSFDFRIVRESDKNQNEKGIFYESRDDIPEGINPHVFIRYSHA